MRIIEFLANLVIAFLVFCASIVAIVLSIFRKGM